MMGTLSFPILVATFFIGAFTFYLIFRIKRGGFERLGEQILQNTEKEVIQKKAALELALKEREYQEKTALRAKLAEMESKFTKWEERLEKRAFEQEKREKEQQKAKHEVTAKLAKASSAEESAKKLVEQLAELTPEQARLHVITEMKSEMEQERYSFIKREKQEREELAEKEAQVILTTAINRLSLPTASEAALITVSLPHHEMKARVIGREGRNIQALEKATGVSFVIDDTPNAVLISGFDPFRREVAKLALLELIQDGRIHPTRIEEVVKKSEARINREVKLYGQKAAAQAGCHDLHESLISLLGSLHFRFSYGQNVLAHSLEVSYLMGMLAAELKLDKSLAKRIGLLHDIGKALSQEGEFSHALEGEQVALRYGESEEVANGIGSHHDEKAPVTLEGSLCSAANTLSAQRIGARSEALEHTLKRASKLEQICRLFEGVEKAYAFHAGREVRVLVEPDKFDDRKTFLLAREIAKKIENELSYPGKIRVTVIREKQAIEYAR